MHAKKSNEIPIVPKPILDSNRLESQCVQYYDSIALAWWGIVVMVVFVVMEKLACSSPFVSFMVFFSLKAKSLDMVPPSVLPAASTTNSATFDSQCEVEFD